MCNGDKLCPNIRKHLRGFTCGNTHLSINHTKSAIIFQIYRSHIFESETGSENELQQFI